MKENRSSPTRKRTKPMPTIKSNPNIKGPMSVTPEYKEAYKEKKKEDQEFNKRKLEQDLIHLLTRRARFRSVLSTLDISKKKDSKKIADINIELRRIEEEINNIEEQLGHKFGDIDRGSKLKRFLHTFKIKLKKFVKSCKDFWNNNKQDIIATAGIVIGIVVGIFVLKWKAAS